jgi:hypothetical protein
MVLIIEKRNAIDKSGLEFFQFSKRGGIAEPLRAYNYIFFIEVSTSPDE